MDEDRLPTAVWVDAHLRRLDKQGKAYYVVNKGAHVSGIVLLKINNLDRQCALLIQQRDLDDNLGWMHALGEETVEETKADAYISRAVERDPDLWVIEIEDRDMQNPFEGKIFV